jgi:hypothetical protein
MRALSLFLFAALLSAAEAQCRPATLPTPGSSLICWSSGYHPELIVATPDRMDGADYCMSYTLACTDQNGWCSGQPMGTLVRIFTFIDATSAASMISPSGAFTRATEFLPRNSTLFFLITTFRTPTLSPRSRKRVPERFCVQHRRMQYVGRLK